MKTCSSTSLLSRNAFNWDDQGKLGSDHLGTMNRACSIYRFLLPVLWKDLNPACEGFWDHHISHGYVSVVAEHVPSRWANQAKQV